MIKSKKAVNEIISTIIIMLIMVIVVGIIITGVSSQLSKSKEKLNYDNSIKVRDLVFSAIMETYNSPIEATKEINFSLSNLELVVDSDTETIEVCFVGKNLKFFADGKRLEEDNNKYSYRVLQKVCSGVAFENIDLIRSITLNNKEQARLVFKKITENKISVSVDNETSASWYTQKNEYIYDENAGNWKYRKKILINSGNVLGNLNNVPVTITLTDEDLKNFANNDGSDLLFTLSDGVTKLKKKITDYDHETGELTVLLTIPSFDVGSDVNIYTYDEKTRKKITIDHTKVDDDLNDFPVLISLEDEDLATLAKEDGSDIYFTASDGTTRLKREIEDYNSTTGALVAWVKIPSLSSTTDTDIYMYFGDENESNTNDTDVWDSNAALVMHFNNNALDSTSYTNNGTVSGSPEYASGIGAKAMYFDGNNDYVSLGTKSINSPLQMRNGIVTVQHWIKPESWTASTKYLFLGSAGGGWRGYGTKLSSSTGQYGFEVYGETGGRQSSGLNLGIGVSQWNQITTIFDGVNNQIITYYNGVLKTPYNLSEPGDVNSTSQFIIGTHISTGYYKGIMDELKVYNKELSPSWIKTEYNNQSSPSTFYSVGEMADANVVILTTPTAANANTGVYVYFGNPNANISDNDIGDGNAVNVTIGVLEKS